MPLQLRVLEFTAKEISIVLYIGQDLESKWIKILDPSLTVLGALQTYVMTLILRPWLGSEWKNWLH